MKFLGCPLRRRVVLRLGSLTEQRPVWPGPALRGVHVGYGISLPAAHGRGSAREPGQCLTRLTTQGSLGLLSLPVLHRRPLLLLDPASRGLWPLGVMMGTVGCHLRGQFLEQLLGASLPLG